MQAVFELRAARWSIWTPPSSSTARPGWARSCSRVPSTSRARGATGRFVGGELRGHSGRAVRVGALRLPRKGAFTGATRAPPRALPDGQRRHPAPRRDRRDAAASAAKLLRAIEEKKVTSVGPDRSGGRRRALHRHDQQGSSRRRSSAGRFRPRPVLPPLGHARSACPLCASGRRTSRCWPSTSSSPANRRCKKSVHGIAPESRQALRRLPVARQRPRARERHRARRHRAQAGDVLDGAGALPRPRRRARAGGPLAAVPRRQGAGGGGLRARLRRRACSTPTAAKLTAAAKHADMDPKNFSDKMVRYGLRRQRPAVVGDGGRSA